MELLNEIWQAARRNKLRTSLTGFAVAWGIFMLIVLLGAGNGLINGMTKQNAKWLRNSMKVMGWATSKPYQGLREGRQIDLNEADLLTTQTAFPTVIDEVGATYDKAPLTVSLGENYINTTLSGVYPNHFDIDKQEMLYGRFVNAIDIKEKRKVIVLGNNQAKTLTKNVPALVGRYVKVGDLPFRVVGIYKEQENGQASAFSSHSTVRAIYDHDGDVGDLEFSFHGLPTEQANTRFETDYRAQLAPHHSMAPDDDNAIWIWNRYTQGMQMDKGMGYIRTALWIVGLFTLLSGIVGVSNIMLITVKERTHEFGIRKAIGARPWSILRLIITESLIITAIFGYIGMLLGIAANEYMDATLGHDVIDTGLFRTSMFVDPTVGLDVCIEATAVIIIAGTVAGLLPALKAARIRPIEALRA